jgi:hypothetical protein
VSPVRRLRRPRTTLGITATLVVAIVLIDVVASAASYLTYRDAPPRMPRFETDGVRVVDPAIDAYSPMPAIYGFSATSLPSSVTDDGEGRLTYTVENIDTVQPDVNAGYALAAIDQFRRTGQRSWLERAQNALDQVLATARRGLYPHKFPARNDLQQVVAPGWHSAQTQGLVLSAAVRLAELTGHRRWQRVAERTFSTFLRFRAFADEDGHFDDDWVSSVDNNAFLWFEIYPTASTPTSVITAHDFALIGIYDYWRTARPGVRRDTAQILLDGGVTTLLHTLTVVRRAGGISQNSTIAGQRDPHAHRTVVVQTRLLAEVTGDALLARLSAELDRDVPDG